MPRRATVSPAKRVLSNFEFITKVPGSREEQAALSEILTRALEGLPGPWKVGVCRGQVVAWVILSVFREDGLECSMFLDEPMKQTALYVREQLVEALRLQDMESSRPRSSAVKKPGA
jgi:hypothetical protein